jgi:hypothetical protein
MATKEFHDVEGVMMAASRLARDEARAGFDEAVRASALDWAGEGTDRAMLRSIERRAEAYEEASRVGKAPELVAAQSGHQGRTGRVARVYDDYSVDFASGFSASLWAAADAAAFRRMTDAVIRRDAATVIAQNARMSANYSAAFAASGHELIGDVERLDAAETARVLDKEERKRRQAQSQEDLVEARQDQIQAQLLPLGFRMEPSLSALGGDEGHALMSIETGEMVDPPNAVVLRLAAEWSLLAGAVTDDADADAVANAFANAASATSTKLTFEVWHDGDSSVGLLGDRASVDVDVGGFDGVDRAEYEAALREALARTFGELWDTRVKVATGAELAADEILAEPANQAATSRGAWRRGDVLKYGRFEQYELEVSAGLFSHSGFGQGHYYGADGTVTFVERDAARARADHEQVPFVYLDRDSVTLRRAADVQPAPSADAAAPLASGGGSAEKAATYQFTMGTGDRWNCLDDDGFGISLRPVGGGVAWDWSASKVWWVGVGTGQATGREEAVKAACEALVGAGLSLDRLPLAGAAAPSSAVSRAAVSEARARVAGQTPGSAPDDDSTPLWLQDTAEGASVRERMEWRFIANTLAECRKIVESDGSRQSWLDPALNIAKERASKVGTRQAAVELQQPGESLAAHTAEAPARLSPASVDDRAHEDYALGGLASLVGAVREWGFRAGGQFVPDSAPSLLAAKVLRAAEAAADLRNPGYVLAFPGSNDAETSELIESLRAGGTEVHRVPTVEAAVALQAVAAQGAALSLEDPKP